MSTLLRLEQVTLGASVGQGLILRPISLQIQPGEFVALLGPSGAGKSSLLKLMNRLTSPSSGAIYFRETAIEMLPVTQLRQAVMLVGQAYRLLGMTAEAALHYPLELQSMAKTQRTAKVRACVERLQIPPDWLHRTELELSGGQQQQVAIARALVTEPALLLLDEPTSAQDLGAATRILLAIQAEVRERGLSVIMSNHQLELAQKVCDRVLYLEKGRLLKDEPATQVDWSALRQSLLTAAAREEEEWGEP